MIKSLAFALLAAISAGQDGDVKIPKAELNQAQLDGVLGMVFGVAGIVAVVFIVLGGIKYSISQGNASDLEKAKDMIVYALVGLGFVIFSFVITQFVTASLFG